MPPSFLARPHPRRAASWRRAAITLGLAWAATFAAAPSFAQSPPIDPKIKNAARELGTDGLRLFQQKKWAEALDRFDRADKLVPAPTLGIHAARCLAQLGRLVEASERYLEVSRYKLSPRDGWAYRRAVKEAQSERDKLMPRIPNLEILLEGPRGDGVKVTMDDAAVPEELIGAAYPVDPGTHEVVATRDVDVVRATTVIKERETVQVVLQLPPLRPKPPPPEPPSSFDMSTWGWVGIGVGATGLLAGAVHGGIALAQQSDLEARCLDRACTPEAHGAADAYDATRAATTLGFVLGGIGLAAGVTLLLLDDDEPGDGQGTALRLEVGAGWVGLDGTLP